jgi:hypothetical protein
MKTTTKKKTGRSVKRWSADVTAHSNAMDLEKDVFRQSDPGKIGVTRKGLESSVA